VIEGKSLRTFDPDSLLISSLDLSNHRGWEGLMPHQFGLEAIRVGVRDRWGISHLACYRFSHILAVEASPKWRAMKSERAARRKREAEEHERESREYARRCAAEKRVHDTILRADTTTARGRAQKAKAFRALAEYLRHDIGEGVTTLSSDGVKSYLHLTKKEQEAAVKSGQLVRKRSIGWEYDAKKVLAYTTYLAASLEDQEKAIA
jgi:hypothetical protein